MYSGQDLGANYFKEYTDFRVWSTSAQRIKLVLYDHYFDDQGTEYDMWKADDGIWEVRLKGDYKNKYYHYKVTIGELERVTVDPYAKGASINGDRGMIVDFEAINPKGWREHGIPVPLKPTEAILYELHVRDFSIDTRSGIKNKGKYLAFTESGTKGTGKISTGLDHLKELGVTHIHFMPIFDFDSIDERLENGYNWGYDPYLYFVPEGSYATNPYDGSTRIAELKKMIMKLHENNLRVVMDVVFNHTSKTENSPFQILAPDYYFRKNLDGSYSNGSGCGNEIASEKPMVRKFIVDCLKFWVQEYKVDGFRFDLMALMDLQTMTVVHDELKTLNPNILLYGEPWTGGDSALDHRLRFYKGRQRGTGIAVFNDEFRNAIKGDNDGGSWGFVNGAAGLEQEIKKGVIGSICYNETICGFAKEPVEVINYVSSHDNLTLFDKINKANPEASALDREKMNRLALSVILTSQGIPFIHSGSEMMRTKQENPNSYHAGDEINKLDWCGKNKYLETFLYIKGLISIRKSIKAMRMEKSEDIIENVRFLDAPSNSVAYLIVSKYDIYQYIFIIHNANRQEIVMDIPLQGTWRVIANGSEASLLGVGSSEAKVQSVIKVSPLSTYILVQ